MAFNATYLTADSGQDFISVALVHFHLEPQPQASREKMLYVAEDDEIEDGKLIDTIELENSPGHNHDVGTMEMVDSATVPDVAGVD